MTESVNANSGIVPEDEMSVPEIVALTPTDPLAAMAPEIVAVSPVGEIVSPAEGFSVQFTVVPPPYGVAPTEKPKGTFDYCDYETGRFKVTVGF